MEEYERILVGLALADRDKTTIQYASMVSRLAASKKIHFVHVVRHYEVPQAIRDAYPKLLVPEDETAEARMVGMVRRYFDGPPGTEVTCDVVEGSPVTEILDLVRREQIDLVMAGKTSRHQNSGFLPEKLARKCPCSVLVVPEATRPEITNMLAAVDFSEHSVDAMETAVALARAVPIKRIRCLHAYWLPHVMHPAADGSNKGFHAFLKECAEKRYREFVRGLDYEGVVIVPELVMEKYASKAIMADISEQEADLVVVGTRGRTAAAAVLLGSVTERLLTMTNVPLLAVKRKGTGLRFLEALLERN